MASTASNAAMGRIGNRRGRQARPTTCFLTLTAVVLLAGCNHTHNADVVATVNGHAIMRADMERMYKELAGDPQNQNQPTSAEQTDALRLEAVTNLINGEIVEQRAAKMNLTATPEEVDAKITEIKAPFTEEQFQQRLKDSGLTLDDEKHMVRRGLTMQKLIVKEIDSKVTVSDADVADYYKQHRAEFNFIEPMSHLARIQVTSVPSPQPGNLKGSKATTDAEAKKKIQALKNMLDSGEDFGTIAMNFSEDPNTAPSGGDMGFVSESQLKSLPTVGAAILNLKPGAVTDIFPLPDQQGKPVGYAIYKLIERQPAGQRDISDPVVQQQIRQLLHDGRSQLLKGAYFEMLRDQAKVENFFAEQIVTNGAK
jgi:peptidyl-prolyl cis-trans isomerase SurA